MQAHEIRSVVYLKRTEIRSVLLWIWRNCVFTFSTSGTKILETRNKQFHKFGRFAHLLTEFASYLVIKDSANSQLPSHSGISVQGISLKSTYTKSHLVGALDRLFCKKKKLGNFLGICDHLC
jgi:hypothetical protein